MAPAHRYNAVRGNAFPGPNMHPVANADFLYRDDKDRGTALNSRDPRPLGKQSSYGATRLTLATRFEHLPDHHQGDDHGGRFEIDGEAARVEAEQKDT